MQPLSRGGFPEQTSGGDRRLDPSLFIVSIPSGGEAQQFNFTSTTRSVAVQHLSSLSSFPFSFFLYSLQFGCQVDVVQPIGFFPPCFCRSNTTTTHLPHQRQSNTMAAQAALIADTIVGMKRALRKEQDCEWDGLVNELPAR